MAESSVVKEQLTGLMIDAGAELTARLDESGLPITTALWFFVPDLNEWRLLFASPDVATKGPRDNHESRLAPEPSARGIDPAVGPARYAESQPN